CPTLSSPQAITLPAFRARAKSESSSWPAAMASTPDKASTGTVVGSEQSEGLYGCQAITPAVPAACARSAAVTGITASNPASAPRPNIAVDPMIAPSRRRSGTLHRTPETPAQDPFVD